MHWATILTHKYKKWQPTTPTDQSQVRVKTEKKNFGGYFSILKMNALEI